MGRRASRKEQQKHKPLKNNTLHALFSHFPVIKSLLKGGEGFQKNKLCACANKAKKPVAFAISWLGLKKGISVPNKISGTGRLPEKTL
jgi:hypothetical protein